MQSIGDTIQLQVTKRERKQTRDRLKKQSRISSVDGPIGIVVKCAGILCDDYITNVRYLTCDSGEWLSDGDAGVRIVIHKAYKVPLSFKDVKCRQGVWVDSSLPPAHEAILYHGVEEFVLLDNPIADKIAEWSRELDDIIGVKPPADTPHSHGVVLGCYPPWPKAMIELDNNLFPSAKRLKWVENRGAHSHGKDAHTFRKRLRTSFDVSRTGGGSACGIGLFYLMETKSDDLDWIHQRTTEICGVDNEKI